jgi:hypothetical protein
MRILAIAALGLIACGRATQVPSPAEGGDAAANAANAEGGPEGRTADGDAAESSDAPEVGPDTLDPFRCSTISPLVLSDPTVISGTVTAGQTATLQITLRDADPNGYVSYPGVVLTSSDAGVRFVSQSGPPGAYIDGKTSKQVPFTLAFDASLPIGTGIEFKARVYGWGHSAPDCPNAFVLNFSLTVR